MTDYLDKFKRLAVALRVKYQLGFEYLIEQDKFYLMTTGEIDSDEYLNLLKETKFYGFEATGWTKKGYIFQVQFMTT